jgi:hypothetical protein
MGSGGFCAASDAVELRVESAVDGRGDGDGLEDIEVTVEYAQFFHESLEVDCSCCCSGSATTSNAPS